MFDNTIEDSAIWDHDTGETVGQARARFATFGPLLTANEAIAELLAAEIRGEHIDMMSFGYGDDPVDFDSVGLEELVDNVKEDGPAEVDRYWGPFAIWGDAQ